MLASVKRNGWLSWILLVDVAIFACIVLGVLPAFAGDGGGDKPWYSGFLPILLLLGAIAIVVWRMPRVKEEFPGQLAHLKDPKYRLRRMLNWLLLGATYAFLYWGRYNLNVSYSAIGGAEGVMDFNLIFGFGAGVYGISFLLNGPLTDRFGGRFSILLGASGAAVANALMGLVCWLVANKTIEGGSLFWYIIVLYAINMYFQSFGAVAIVKANSAWFHVRERGVFGAIFGILISLGVYFAYDWSRYILKGLEMSVEWTFFAPAIALVIAFILDLFVVRNRPSDAGYADFNTGDASSGQGAEPDPPIKVFKMMLSSSVVMTIACIEFCSGFLRQAIMQMYRKFVEATGGTELFTYQNWGMLLCVAGILGGVFAGTISDHVFGSRRGPVAAVLYVGMLLGSIGMFFLLGSPHLLGPLVIVMSLCIIGVHGMLSGTASMDFGGTRNVGIAVGIIDGFVYAGSSLQGFLYARTLPKSADAVGASDIANWQSWPIAMIPIALIGLVLAILIWSKKAKPKFTLEFGDPVAIWHNDRAQRVIAEVIRAKYISVGKKKELRLTVKLEEEGPLACLEHHHFFFIESETAQLQTDVREHTRAYLDSCASWGNVVASGLRRFDAPDGKLHEIS
ncbi:MAG: MFS transporter [Candidatus Uhrbacteria bacterium]